MSVKRDDLWCRSLAGRAVGKYELVEFIGAGRIGYVYRALHRDVPDSPWALKLTFDQLKSGWKTEVRKVAKLGLIDGVVHFHDLGAETLTHKNVSRLAQYTVWDYISPGENLKGYLIKIRTIPTSFLLAVVEQVLRVLHACEKQGVTRHGDLHSGNILIGDPSAARLDDTLQPRASIYVSDFGYGTTGAALYDFKRNRSPNSNSD
jgi:serine/threonine protein kinase